MNHMRQVAKMLGVELNDEFILLDSDLDLETIGKYRITSKGLEFYNEWEYKWIPESGLRLKHLLRGRYRIGEVLWQPKDNEIYYIPVIHNGEPQWTMSTWCKEDLCEAKARYKAGIVCRTEVEAKVKAKMMLDALRENNYTSSMPNEIVKEATRKEEI